MDNLTPLELIRVTTYLFIALPLFWIASNIVLLYAISKYGYETARQRLPDPLYPIYKWFKR